jgi:type VI secretion system protein
MVERDRGVATAGAEQSLLEHLRALLNTRQGSSALDPNYGVPDLTGPLHDFPQGIAALQRELELTIRRGEPRLACVSVRPLRLDENSLVLRFQVVGQLSNGITLRFQTEISRGGYVHIG